jgi:hypothetical protein
MPASKYKLIAVGPQAAASATAPVHVHLAGIAKKAIPGQPYIVANELVCSRIAGALLLPCPPGALMQKDVDTYFFSLDFNIAGQALPPASASAVVSKFPRLAWGIIVFDAFVMNVDRHPANIAHDTSTDAVQIFDHSHAFMGPSADIDQTLTARQNDLAIGGHCLAAEINTIDGKNDWIRKVGLIPDYFIEGLIAAACDCGIPPDKKGSLITFVKHRRDNLKILFDASMNRFSKVPTVVAP